MSASIPFHVTTLWYLAVLVFLCCQVWRKCRFEPQPLLLRWYIFIPAVLALGSIFANLGGERLALFSYEVAVGIVLGFIHPIFASGFLLANLLIRPWEIAPPNELTEIIPRTLASLSFASLLLHRVRTRNARLVWNLPIGIFLIFMGWLWLSALLASNRDLALKDFFEQMIPVIACFLLVVNSIEEELDIETIRGATVIAIAGIISIAFVATLRYYNFVGKPPRLEGLGAWSNSNDITSLMVFQLPLFIPPLLLRSRSPLNWTLALMLIIPTIAALWLGQSRGAFLGLFVALVAYVLTRKKLRPRTLVMSLIVLAVPVIMAFSIHRKESDLDESSTMRFNYALAGIRMATAHPFLGVGFGNYPQMFEQYTTAFLEWGKRTAHSSWILVLSESGFIGLILFAWLFLLAVRRAYQLRATRPEYLLTLAGYGTCMTFLSHSYLLPIYLLIAMTVSASRLSQGPAVLED